MLQLQVPLDRIAAPQVPTLSAEGSAAVPEAEAKDESTQDAPARTPDVPPRARTRLASDLARRLVREALRVRGEPDVRDRLDGLAGRSRSAALLPELTLRGVRSTDQSLRLTPAGVDRYELTQTGGADLLLEARATWNLDRLLFTDEELRIEHLRRDYADAAERLALLVLRHLFIWQRAQSRLQTGELDAETSLEVELQMMEAEASLDVLTDGLFGRTLAAWDRAGGVRPGHSTKTE